MDFDSLEDDGATQGARGPAQAVPASGSPPSFDELPDDSEKYGTLPQQALTIAEGLGKGYVGPVATLAEKGLTALGVPGLSPEEQAGRESGNPWDSGVSQAVGLGAGILTGTGEAALLSKAGQGALKLAGVVSKPATLIGRAAAGALSNAVETAAFQTGDEISKRINDPNASAAAALTHIGLAGILGGAGGAILGPISPLWAHTHGEAVEQGINDFKNSMTGSVADQVAEGPAQEIRSAGFSGMLGKQKINAPELTDIAARNEWPIAEGITSGSKEIQKAEDALLNGPPTIASLSRQKIYNDIYSKVDTSVDRATATSARVMSETEAGNALKTSLSDKLEAENAPIKAGYKEIEPYQQAIPVSDKSTGALSRNIEKIIDDQNLVKGTERYNFVKTMADGIDQVDNLQRLKNFRTEVWKSSGPLTKDLAGAIGDKLNGVESRAIRKYAETMKTPVARQKILDVADKLETVNSQYGPFKEKLKSLGKNIGKTNVHGPQDFIDFIDNMNPQALARRLFNENNTEFSQYFAKQFPEEMNIMRGYQRGLVRQGAMKDGVFNTPRAIKSVLEMEPEMQNLLYAKSEIGVLKDADEYLRNFPKNFNPSGTDHTSAFRSFFEHPTGAVIANLRDYGIQSFIKAFGKASPGAEGEAERLIPLLGRSAAKNDVNPGAFKHAVGYTMAAIKGENTMGKAVKSLFSAAGPVAATFAPKEEHVKSLDEKLKEFQANKDKHAAVGGSVDHYLPNHDIALKSMAMNAENYLNSARPVAKKNSPLDKEIQPNKADQAGFNRLLAIGHQPLSILDYVKSGQITSNDVSHLKAMYPGVYSDLSQKIHDEMIKHVSDGNTIPYSMRRSLSIFLGQPLDSTMTQPAMATIMMANAPKSGGQQPQGAHGKIGKPTAASMEKTDKMYATPAQSRAASRGKS